METLKLACLSGVDFRIMIPSKPDHPFVYWASYSYAGELLDYGAKIYTDHPFVYWASYSYAGELLDYGAKIYTYGEDAFLLRT